MSDKPILFSGPMVRALLDGRKTQTRRVLKPQPSDLVGVPSGCKTVAPYMTNSPERGLAYYWRGLGGAWNSSPPFFTPYTPGDRMWVREAWRSCAQMDSVKPSKMSPYEPVRYEADGSIRELSCAMLSPGKLRPSMFAPRWSSRLTLTVTDVRVQRVQDISVNDAIAEGRPEGGDFLSARRWFRDLWDILNKPRGFGWDANPWVCALTFTVHHRNIDEMEAAQ